MAIARNIETKIHGRFLFEDRGHERLIVGFHGYAETAEAHLAELQKIAGIDRWSVAAVQALHPFYTRSGSVVANWMTSLDREIAVADNLAYVGNVLASLPTPTTLVFSGFSQGAAMAYRAAAAFPQAAAVIVLGGDLPPDVTANLPPILIGRGVRDEWFTAEKFDKDLKSLAGRAQVTTCVFDGGHEWSDEYRRAASEFLARCPTVSTA